MKRGIAIIQTRFAVALSIFADPFYDSTLQSAPILWEYSPLWLLPAFVLALVLALLLYRKSQDYSPTIKAVLFGLRTLLFTGLFALFLNPLIRKFQESLFPPVTVVLVDNSRSVAKGSDPDSLRFFQQNLNRLRKKLEEAGSKVFYQDLQGKGVSDSAIQYALERTAIEPSIRQISEAFENQNLAQVILASDGIINSGSDLSTTHFPFPVQTIRLGNPSSRKDLRIEEVQVNKVAFLGNRFPIRVLVRARKPESAMVAVSIWEGNNRLEQQSVPISSSGLASVEFKIKPSSKGLKQYSVRVEPIAGEITVENNQRSVFIEVVDSKQKVLLLASAPHPDLKAIRAALSEVEQIELNTVVGGLDVLKSDAWNLVILHQLPDRQATFGQAVSTFLKSNSQNLLLWVTPQTDLNRLRLEANAWLNVQPGYGAEEVGGDWNPDFQRFVFEEKWKNRFQDLPPLRSSTGSYSWRGTSETLLQQRLGRVVSPTPLFSLASTNSVQRGIFWGDGIWLWRLNEFARHENTEAVDNLIRKSVQLLVSSEKKKRLRVLPTNREWQTQEPVYFQAETFNALFEPVFDQNVQLEIRRSDGWNKQFSFVTAQGNPPFRLPGLAPGIYRYKATAALNGKEESDEGEFLVRNNELEAQDLEARHDLLRNLAASSEGISTGISDMARLEDASRLPKPLITYSDWNESILRMPWILGLLLGLAITEWALRKSQGSL